MMPRKGYRKPKPLTTDDYGMSLHHMQAILQNAHGLAMRHPDLPRMAVLLTIAQDAEKELTAAALLAARHDLSTGADQRSTGPSTPGSDLASVEQEKVTP